MLCIWLIILLIACGLLSLVILHFAKFFLEFISFILFFAQSYEEENGGTYVGSFPKGFGYGPEETDPEAANTSPEEQPRILLMGLRRCVSLISF